jgi:hypothetical protein
MAKFGSEVQQVLSRVVVIETLPEACGVREARATRAKLALGQAHFKGVAGYGVPRNRIQPLPARPLELKRLTSSELSAKQACRIASEGEEWSLVSGWEKVSDFTDGNRAGKLQDRLAKVKLSGSRPDQRYDFSADVGSSTRGGLGSSKPNVGLQANPTENPPVHKTIAVVNRAKRAALAETSRVL